MLGFVGVVAGAALLIVLALRGVSVIVASILCSLVIAVANLDSLPHCGAIITMLTIMGLSHKEAYKDVAVVTVVIPLIALVSILAVMLIWV